MPRGYISLCCLKAGQSHWSKIMNMIALSPFMKNIKHCNFIIIATLLYFNFLSEKTTVAIIHLDAYNKSNKNGKTLVFVVHIFIYYAINPVNMPCFSHLIVYGFQNRARYATNYHFTCQELSLQVCSIHPDLKEAIHKFRFRRETNNAAIIMKVNVDTQNVIVEESLDVEDLEDLKNNITDTQPRFVLLSWTIQHKDGRTSYPMAFIFLTPRDCKPQLQMMYAGTYNHLVEECQLTKVFQLRDIDELDEEWIETHLAK